MENEKRYALITGATSGIGYELAKLFAKDGHNLVIVARTESELQKKAEEFRNEFKVDVIPIAKDLFFAEAAFELYDELQAQEIFVDVLVNDAGQGQYGQFVETDIERLLDIIQLNISSLTSLTWLFLQEMVRRNEGKILQLASIASEIPGPWNAVYHATKAYVLSFTESLIAELDETEVIMTALQPGATATDFFNKAQMQDSLFQ